MTLRDRHRDTSIAFLESSGAFAVRIRPGSKAADASWRPKDHTLGRSQQVLANLEPEDNLAAHLHGPLIDVDVDAEDEQAFLVPALDLLMPACPHVWGRETRPRTHRAYVLEEGKFEPTKHRLLQRLATIPEAKIELLGGEKSRGNYVVLPGSVHPDDQKLYEWSDLDQASATPAVVPLDRILRGIRLAGAVAVLAPYWTEGARQEMTLALAGFMHRVSDVSASLDSKFFAPTKEDAVTLLEIVLELTGDTAERSMRRKAFDITWQKAVDGEPVTGATRLAQIADDRDLVSKLYALLSDAPEMAEIEDFVARFAIWRGPAVAIDREALRSGGQHVFMKKAQFSASYGDLWIEIDGKRKLLPDMLWSMKAATRVMGMTFDPARPEIVPERAGDYLNQWSGFAVQPWPEAVEASQIRMFLDYLHDVVCGGVDVHYEWVLAWLADIFQEPGNKSGTALVLVGLPGVGKTFLGENIIGPIIGERHFGQANAIAHVTHNFNSLYANQLLIQCDEALSARQKAEASRLKALITDAKQRVENKGIDAYRNPSHARFIFTSNETEEAIHLDQGYDDRRYTVLEVPPVEKGHLEEYWFPLAEWCRNLDNLAKVHRYLRDHEYNKALIKLPLRTAAKETMQQRSWDELDGWLAAMLTRDFPLSEEAHQNWYDAPFKRSKHSPWSADIEREYWPAWISWEALALDYRIWLRSQPGRHVPLNAAQLSSMLQGRAIYDAHKGRHLRVSVQEYDERTNKTTRRRVRVSHCFARHRVASYLAERHGYTVDNQNDPADDAGTEQPDDDMEDF